MAQTIDNHILNPRLVEPAYLLMRSLRDALAVHAGQCSGVVVDYGCGNKPYESLFSQAARYVGVDGGASGHDMFDLRPDGGMPLDDNFADVVLSSQVLEHVPDVDFYLRECYRVLRPGGRLLLSTHGIWPYHPSLGYDDFTRWTGAGLARSIDAQGFKVSRVQKICPGRMCLVQQWLVVNDPFRRRPRRLVRYWQKAANFSVNSLCLGALALAPKYFKSGDIVPIVYLASAVKTN